MSKIWILAILAMLVSCKGTTEGGNTAETTTETEVAEAEQTVRILSTNQFNDQLSQYREAGTEFQLIDIRTPEELAETGYIPGAVNIDFYESDFRSKMGGLDKNQPVLLYCRSGNRSGQASDMLLDLGFTEVYDLAGGIVGWNAAGNPVEMPEAVTAE